MAGTEAINRLQFSYLDPYATSNNLTERRLGVPRSSIVKNYGRVTITTPVNNLGVLIFRTQKPTPLDASLSSPRSGQLVKSGPEVMLSLSSQPEQPVTPSSLNEDPKPKHLGISIDKPA